MWEWGRWDEEMQGKWRKSRGTQFPMTCGSCI
jgi:hypothetical protein